MKKEREFATWFILQHGPRPHMVSWWDGATRIVVSDQAHRRWDELYAASLLAYRKGIRQGATQDPARPAGNVAHLPRRATRRN